MASRTLEITLISAKGLKDVNLISKLAIYAVVSLSGDSRTRQRTPPDREGGRNPSWNSTLRLTVPADDDLARGHFLHILLRTERALGDRDVGEVHVPLPELLSGAGDGPRPVQFVSYQVRKTTSGKPKGVLNFSYKFGERVGAHSTPAPPASYPPPVTAYPAAAVAAGPYRPPAGSKADEPVMAYPVGTSYGTAAPYRPGPGYQQPPQYGYGYPSAGYGYGYGYGAAAAPPQVVQPQRKNKMGMGLGAGLLGGALGGLLIGDMISDASDYDAGYDAGFDDAAGFDF